MNSVHPDHDIRFLMEEIERMQLSFARRNVTSWVAAFEQLLVDCRLCLTGPEKVCD